MASLHQAAAVFFKRTGKANCVGAGCYNTTTTIQEVPWEMSDDMYQCGVAVLVLAVGSGLLFLYKCQWPDYDYEFCNDLYDFYRNTMVVSYKAAVAHFALLTFFYFFPSFLASPLSGSAILMCYLSLNLIRVNHFPKEYESRLWCVFRQTELHKFWFQKPPARLFMELMASFFVVFIICFAFVGFLAEGLCRYRFEMMVKAKEMRGMLMCFKSTFVIILLGYLFFFYMIFKLVQDIKSRRTHHAFDKKYFLNDELNVKVYGFFFIEILFVFAPAITICLVNIFYDGYPEVCSICIILMMAHAGAYISMYQFKQRMATVRLGTERSTYQPSSTCNLFSGAFTGRFLTHDRDKAISGENAIKAEEAFGLARK